MVFFLGTRSRAELQGVHPALVRLVERAIQITGQDFTVFDGLRTVAEQEQLVKAGASQTMQSLHLKQSDGFGHAVDLVPWINGKPRWEWPAIYPIAEAMQTAADEQDVEIVWGGCWCTLKPGKTPEAMVQEYVSRRIKQGRKAFVDGPHYQLT